MKPVGKLTSPSEPCICHSSTQPFRYTNFSQRRLSYANQMTASHPYLINVNDTPDPKEPAWLFFLCNQLRDTFQPEQSDVPRTAALVAF